MTTVTIERALLKQIIERLTACGCEVCTRQSIEALKAALAAPAAALEPVAWMDDFGNAFPFGANKGAGSWLDAHKRNWKPLYLHPPAAAPDQPAWHDAPTCAGLWVCRQAITDNVQAYEVTDQVALNRNLKLKGQWYGPIPEDK